MRTIVYDTEFIEDGSTIDLISIGAVDKTGNEFYAISTGFDESKASDWVRENVLSKLPPRTDPAWMSRASIRDRLHIWLTQSGPIELWADYGAYDHVALAQLFGTMMDLPDGVPMFTHELQQLWEQAGRPPKPHQTGEHNALDDARYGMALWRLCAERV
jgi:hypothetical protein